MMGQTHYSLGVRRGAELSSGGSWVEVNEWGRGGGDWGNFLAFMGHGGSVTLVRFYYFLT